jgi:ElaB/YqjD/DUF883 family membrane-anchored ribosome-binding protein
MAKKNYPEQRSTHAAAASESVPAQPTGQETFSREEAPGTARQAPETPSQEEIRSTMEELAGEYYKKLAETADELTEHVQELYQSGERYVREHPEVAVVGAFFVGVLTGVLTSRRS